MNHVTRLLLFATALAVATFLALRGMAELPERVATHFNASGAADGWTSRDDYRLLVVVSLIVLPSLLVWLMAGLPRLTNGKGQIPNCEYWFAQERRHETERFLISHACWLGLMTIAILYGIHVTIARANAISPPVLALDRLIMMLSVYLIGLVWWFAALVRHFQGAGSTGER